MDQTDHSARIREAMIGMIGKMEIAGRVVGVMVVIEGAVVETVVSEAVAETVPGEAVGEAVGLMVGEAVGPVVAAAAGAVIEVGVVCSAIEIEVNRSMIEAAGAKVAKAGMGV